MRAAYAVDGTRYEVADSRIGSPNPDWDTVRVGDSVTVYYDPAIPARAVLYEPQARSMDGARFRPSSNAGPSLRARAAASSSSTRSFCAEGAAARKADASGALCVR